MAEPTDRLAINDGVGGRKKSCRYEKRAEMKGKKREEKLICISYEVRIIQTSREKPTQ